MQKILRLCCILFAGYWVGCLLMVAVTPRPHRYDCHGMTRSDCLQWVLAGAEPAARNAAARPDGDDFVFTSPVAAASPGATAALSDED